MRIRLWPIEARFYRTSINFSNFFGAIIFAMIVAPGIEAIKLAEAKAEAQRIARLERLKFEEREIVHLANIVFHEARGENVGVRELVGKVVLAIVNDRQMKLPKTVAELSRVPGFFSNLKNPDTAKFHDANWVKIYNHMNGVYYGPKTLPRGWGCVRGFRVSDDELEKLGPKAIAQLGFTVEAKGLKYFAAHRVPVDTRGSVTFYSPRGGCSNPTPTT